mmetsp:Transcript_98038/g.120067  ORF Transcript_98038/g.120067 Transcript_98038/m.120067 type:complete len:382 (-) Transcript_98038:119-1264(-)
MANPKVNLKVANPKVNLNAANPATLPVAKGVKGAFRREPTAFHNVIESGSEFAPEKDRYHLYVSYACPWCHRCLALIGLKGLEHIIGITNVDPYLSNMDLRNNYDPNKPNDGQFIGWRFNDEYPDPLHPNFKSVWDLYKKAVPDHPNKKLTVPILWDKKTETIVNNESSEIIAMFNVAFNEWAKYPDVDLNPNDKEIQSKMAEIDTLVYPNINDGVYRCGFARSQEAYDDAFKSLFETLDTVEDLLSKQRYLCGNMLTLSDIRLFVTLIRFDNVYYVHFKTNGKMICKDYPNIFNYTKELYQMPNMKKYVDIEQYKLHYYYSHKTINTFQIIPKGPFDVNFDEPHNRGRISTKVKLAIVSALIAAISIGVGFYKKIKNEKE